MAPFVGLGGYAGWVPSIGSADADWDWSDVDGHRDDEDYDALFAVYPEVGCHFWCNSRWRLTASASYQFTTDGRNSDFLLYGVSLARLSGVHQAATFDDPLAMMSQPDVPTTDPAVRETLDRTMVSPNCGTPVEVEIGDPVSADIQSCYRSLSLGSGGELALPAPTANSAGVP